MFTAALAPDVSPPIRSKGLAYFRGGAVLRVEGGEWMVHGVVRGGRDYRVEILRDRGGFLATCDCPYFSDRNEICKHIWATLLAAEQRALLGGEGAPLTEVWLEPGEISIEPVATSPAAPRGKASRTAPATPAPTWSRFLDELRARQLSEDASVRLPRFEGGELVYAIDVTASMSGEAVLSALVRHRKRSGDWGKPKPVAISAREADQLDDAQDREIFALLMGARDPSAYTAMQYDAAYSRPSSYRVASALAERILPLVVGTGRAHLTLGDAELRPIEMDDGPAWRFELEVTVQPATDTVRIDGAFVRPDARMALRDPVLVLSHGFLFTAAAMSRLEIGGDFAWLTQLRRSGPVDVPRTEAGVLAEALARSDVDPVSLPSELRYEVIEAPPRPTLRIMRPKHEYRYVARPDLQATVQFEYDGIAVDPASGGATFEPDRRRLIRRHLGAEQAAIERLYQLGFRKIWDFISAKQGLGITVEQFPRIVGTLVKEGWRVEADGQTFRSAQSTYMTVASGIDWFELQGAVDFGDGISAPVPQLLAALERGEDTVVLDDGSTGLLPEDWLRRYAGIARFGKAEGGHFRFQQNQAALLDALLADQPAIAFDETFAQARRELAAFEGIQAVDAPASFHGELRAYQRDALGWFGFLRRFGFGGCLADDMGLGKTVMVLALLEARRKESRKRDAPRTSLAIVPRSLVFNWMEEATRFVPNLRVLDYTGPTRDAALFAQSDLVLTTYGTLRRDALQLKDLEFDYLILDEAQAIKNPATASSKGARLLRARHRLALSGTPVENHLGELWSLVDFLNPGLLGSSAAFQRRVGRAPATDDLAWLSRAMRPFFLRRTKEQVAPELPPRIEQTIHCELEGAQRKHYDELRAYYRRTLLERVARSGLNRSKIQILEALLRLRQAACHSGLIDAARAGDGSAKFDLLLPRLREIIGEGHKALVFSQFTSLLALLRPLLEADGIVYEYLDGATRDRAAHVTRFQTDPACPVFLISLKAGGQGLNLTAADYVFLLDPWWNPAVEAQAIDRAHRIGQARHVFAYRLIARDTVEEKVLELQESKRALADAIVRADASLVRTLQTEDLELLLS